MHDLSNHPVRSSRDALKIHHDEKQQLWIILLIVFISFLGTSIAYPIFPPLFLYPAEHSIIPYDWNIQTRSILLGLALALYPFGQFLGSPILGGCSDRYGRKPLLILSLIGCILGYFLTAWSLYKNSLGMLLFSRFLTGCMEGNFAIVRAMAIDLSTINKYKSLGRINGMTAIGYVMGPLIGGFLSDPTIIPWFSYAFPFFLAMLFSVLTAFLAIFKLRENSTITPNTTITLWNRFNLIARFKFLFQTNATLKSLLIISTVFTFSADIFYEFGPVYLTGLWSLTPAGIAIYNIAVALTLAIGSSWLSHYLSLHFKTAHVIIIAMLMTSLVFGCMILFPQKILMFILFGMIGLTIATTNVNLSVVISNSADATIQGEAMGAQLSLRTLGDAVICLLGGYLIAYSVALPIVLSCLIAGFALIMYYRYLLK